ncbi:antibiotic biosynthesis monooxygenase [Streptomyces sp. NPDC048278]|uniref:antibiotic biosynthesis monooxygenase family protein n=1 Tax=Streptomyces sp. NPDC048278 TaxID=3155809 RepID=UPI003428C715
MVILVLFRSRLSERADKEYDITEDRLARRVRELAGDDLVHIKNYTSDDGERLALVWWRDPETLERWRTDPEHQEAQRLGREQWYSFYELTVAEVIRTSSGEDPSRYPGR